MKETLVEVPTPLGCIRGRGIFGILMLSVECRGN